MSYVQKNKQAIIHEMMPANMAPEFEIKVKEKGFYHYRGTRLHLSPADPLRPFYTYKIIPLRFVDYETFFNVPEEQKIRNMQAMNFVEMQLIHDPFKDTEMKQPTPAEEEARRKQAVAAEAEGRRKARVAKLNIGDLVTRDELGNE